MLFKFLGAHNLSSERKITLGLPWPFLSHKSMRRPLDTMPNNKKLTDIQRVQAVSRLQSVLVDDELPWGEITRTADFFDVSRQAISVLWLNFCGTEGDLVSKSLESVTRKAGSGRPPKYIVDDLVESVEQIPLRERTCICDLAGKLSVVHRMMTDEDGALRRHTSALKPELKPENKYERYLYAISKVNKETGIFFDMEDEIHVDEKWFYLTLEGQTYILTKAEMDPKRSVGHKSHIPKIMFLAATCKPRYDPHTRQMWGGKIGIWRFARQIPAQRNSVRRDKGTLVWTPYNVGRNEYRAMLIDNVLPAIKEKWPSGTLGQVKWIQQDNCKVHIKADDPEWLAAVAANGIPVQIYNQPPNSPDTNINDLAFFVSIQSLQHKLGSGTSLETLIASVLEAYDQYPWHKLRNAFLTLQCCLNCIIEENGGNKYKIPHMSKEKLENAGMLPMNVRATDAYLQYYEMDEMDIDDNDNDDGDDDDDDANENEN